MRDDTRQGIRGARGDQDRHLSMQHIDIEDRDAVSLALNLLEAGMDLADALHLVRSNRATAFIMFDRRLAKKAEALGPSPRVELLA